MCKRLFYWTPLLLVLGLVLVAEAQVVDSSLIGWWRLDEGSGTTAVDASGSGNNGTLYGGAEWTQGIHGRAVYLDGVNGYLEIPDVLTELGTIAFWFKPDWDGTDPDDYRIFDASLGGIYFFISKGADEANISKEEIGFYLEDVTDADFQNIEFDPAGGVVTAGTWFHIAVTWEFDGGPAILYFNGEEVSRADNLGGFPALNTNPRFGLETFAYIPMTHGAMGAVDEILYYNRVLGSEEIPLLMKTSSERAADPRPADEATDIPQDATLSWMPGELAATHDVYFGTALEDVNSADRATPQGVLLSQNQAATSYDPEGLLAFGQTYYWRIDEVNAAPDNAVFKGDVWSFTAEPYTYPVENITATASSFHNEDMGPQKTADGSGINANDEHSTVGTDMWLSGGAAGFPAWIQYEFDRVQKLSEMWVWNSNQSIEAFVGFGVKDVVVEYSIDGLDWTVLEGVSEFAQAAGATGYAANTKVDFGGAMARFVKITVNGNWGVLPQAGLGEVRFYQVPTYARHPQPAPGATGVALDAALDWRIGRGAVSHEVYFSEEEQAVIDNAALVATLSDHGYPLAGEGLKYGRTYHWKVNEVDDAPAPASVEGDIWDFTTIEYFVVDDMESYDDDLDAGTAIFQTWIDGWDNGTGATVGYVTSPFAERSITNSGAQSMPLDYNNVNSPWYSETSRTWETPQNWTVDGVTHLTVNFRGNAPGFIETGPDSFSMGAAGVDIWGNADEFRYAFKRLSGDGSITARVESIIQTDVWAKAGVMIRESLDAGSKHATTVVTPAQSVSFQRRLVTNDVSTNTDAAAGLVAPYWVRITRSGNTFTARRSADGVTWEPMGVDPAASSVTIDMIGEVYIGLAVTSHASGVSTVAEFSNVSTTGTVTGQWQALAIGVAQPANDAAPLYVAVEDSAGQLKVVSHPDADATVSTAWQVWNVPLSEFVGVNMAKVSTLYIGVGDRDNPTPDGAGVLYIDDIRVGVPAATEATGQ